MNKCLSKTILGLGILALGALSSFAGPYDTWSNYRTVTVNTTTAAVTGTVANFPLLVRLTNADAAHGSDVLTASATGADVRFTDSTGATALSYQIERWTSTAAEIWVLVPNIPGSASTSIRMYWGKSGQSSASNGGAVFDTANGFRSVWHMGDTTGVNPRPNAVSVYSTLTATPRGYPTSYNPAVSGVIGNADTLLGGHGALTYDGNGTYMMIDSGTATNAYDFPNGKFTVSFWANHTRFGQNKRHFHIMASAPGAANPAGALQTIPSNTSTTASVMYFRYSTSPAGTNTYQGSNTGGSNLTQNTWVYITCVVSRGPTLDTLYKYYNGVLNTAGTVTSATLLPAVSRPYAFLGRAFESGTDSAFAGSLDEFELANATRSPDWIKLSYVTQAPAQTAVTLGTTQVTASVPGAATGVTGVAGNAQVAVSWTAPSSDGGATITAYAVSSTPSSSGCSTTGSLSCTVAGLTNGTAYTFTVTATNTAGTGAASAASASVTPVQPVGVPDAPTIGAVTAGNAQVTVNWTAATTGSAATGFTVTSNPDGKTCTTTGAVTCVVSALTNGTAYTFRVVATNTAGSSAASAASASVTPIGPPGTPISVTGVAGNAQVVISWTAPASNGGSAITAYKAMAVSDTTKSCTTTGALTCTVTGLTNGTAYTFTATATNTAGTSVASAASASITPVTFPGAPTNVTFVANPGLPPAGAGSLTVSWVAPVSTGGSPITGYTATATPGALTCTSTGALTCTIASVTTGGLTITVTATNAIGTSAASAPSAVTGILAASRMQGFGFQKAGSTVTFFFPNTSENLRVSVLDPKGRIAWTRTASAGTGGLIWNGKNAQGSPLHGIYMVRFTREVDGKSTILAESKLLLMP